MSIWNKERTDDLIARRRAGATSTALARLYGVTRNSIIGKMTRLVIAGVALPRMGSGPRPERPSRAVRPPRLIVNNDKPKVTVKRSRFSGDIIRGTPQAARPVNMDRMPGDPEPIGKPGAFEGCQWIEGEPTHDAICCGHKRLLGSSYCPTHDARTRNQAHILITEKQYTRFARYVSR